MTPAHQSRVVSRPIEYTDPVAAFAALRGGGMSVLLDSAAEGPDTGRYAFIAVDPVETVRCGWAEAFQQLERLQGCVAGIAPPDGWPLAAGIFGSFGYELRRALENVPSRHPEELGIADLCVGLFDTIVAFDHTERRAAVLACDIDPHRPSASDRAERIGQRLRSAASLPDVDWSGEAAWEADWTPEAYGVQVERIREYIKAGDIYQANFTQRWTAHSDADPFVLYRRLRALSPAPYGALIDDGQGNAILSVSPERFLYLSADGNVDTRPIKGTRPRGTTPDIDRALAAELLTSGKDHAENLMIVDLLRNDLGRVAETGSVAVPALNALTSFASVHHLVSTVTARLRKGLSAVDLLRAAFPGGSVTGAPKIRAMQIIDEMERARRGAYCGAIGWIGLDGAMELSIAIRTLAVTPGRVVAQAGGGIVADSDPGKEYEEALSKARALLAVLDPRYRNSPP